MSTGRKLITPIVINKESQKMKTQELINTAKKLVADDKGILAMEKT
jgi:hypothetical protein